jgi:general secretion pathway protein C
VKLDSFAKRGFPIILGGMIAAAAYFQASGISHLIAYEIARNGAGSVPLLMAFAGAPPDSDPAPSAAPILERNPFDSTTGPLAPPKGEGHAGKGDTPDPDPRKAPVCDKGRVVLIMLSEDPEWSFAAIADAEGHTMLGRRGSPIAGKKLEDMAWDRVWLTSGGARCQMLLGEDGGKPGPAPREKEAPPEPAPPRPAPRGRSLVPTEIASQIRRVGETEIDIERSAAQAILAQPDLVTQTSMAMPDMRGDQAVGLKMRIKPGSVLESIGLQDGDTVRSINGIDLTDPQKAMMAYSRIRSDNRLSVVVERGGRPVRLRVNVR